MSALKGCAMSFRSKGSRVQTEYVFALALLHYGQRQFALLSGIGTVLCINDNLLIDCFLIKGICWFLRKSVISCCQLNK